MLYTVEGGVFVGSATPYVLRSKAEVNGANRTACPDQSHGSSDPMCPGSIDAGWITLCQTGKV